MFRLIEEEIWTGELDPVALPGTDCRPPSVFENGFLPDTALDAAASDGRRRQRWIQSTQRMTRPLRVIIIRRICRLWSRQDRLSWRGCWIDTENSGGRGCRRLFLDAIVNQVAESGIKAVIRWRVAPRDGVVIALLDVMTVGRSVPEDTVWIKNLKNQ